MSLVQRQLFISKIYSPLKIHTITVVFVATIMLFIYTINGEKKFDAKCIITVLSTKILNKIYLKGISISNLKSMTWLFI